MVRDCLCGPSGRRACLVCLLRAFVALGVRLCASVGFSMHVGRSGCSMRGLLGCALLVNDDTSLPRAFEDSSWPCGPVDASL